MNEKRSSISIFHNAFKGRVFTHVKSGRKYGWLQMYCMVERLIFPEYVQRKAQLNPTQTERIVNYTRSMIRQNTVEMADKAGFKNGAAKMFQF